MAPLASPNAFSLIRWLFALSLILFHGSVAAGHAYGWIVSPHSIICVFFVMSGMLTYNSYLLHPGAGAFYLRRIRKIIPPYAAVIILAAAGGAFVSTLGADEYFTHTGTFKYLAANLTFLNFLAPGLPGVFEGNIVTAVNSSLWTMKVEVAFYILLPAMVWLMRRFRPAHVIVALYLLSVVWNIAFQLLYQSTGNGLYDMLRRQVFGQMMYFAAGMAAVHVHTYLLRRKWAVLACSVALWAVCDRYAPLRLVEPVAIAAALTVAACGSARLSRLSARTPNLTYEVYLLHFPVIQVLVATGFFAAAGFYPAITAAAAVILLLSLVLHKAVHRFAAAR